MKKRLKLAILGATGAVGREFLKILEERKTPIDELRLFASSRSQGTKILFQGKDLTVQAPTDGCFKGCDVAFFSAGAGLSEIWGPKAVSDGAFVIDNSSAYRMHGDIALVVPEVNPHRIPKDSAKPCIIANPNCSTIQLVVALKPLHDRFGLKQVTVSTYQSVSGAGTEGMDELKNQTRAVLNSEKEPAPSVFAHPIAFNNIPQIDVFEPNGFTKEEIKIMKESRKILEIPDLNISATAVRTPTLVGHSEAVWIDLAKPIDKKSFLEALKSMKGLVIVDDPATNTYPLNRAATGEDPVYVGRMRQDLYNPNRWVIWVVSDNVRKGAALNGLQIAEKLFGL